MYISDTDLSNCPIYNPIIFQLFLQYKNTAETITKASVNHLGTCNPSSNSSSFIDSSIKYNTDRSVSVFPP